MLHLFRKTQSQFFSEEEKARIVQAIQTAEQRTSGEIRLFIESKCRFVNALDRAVEVFGQLDMHKTAQRNGVLVYVAVVDRQLAVYADEGIFQKAGKSFWNNAVQRMLAAFDKNSYVNGIENIILETGETLAQHFPYDRSSDVNELPDDIVFGK
ncbi:TPM domain-containing protein [Deminuibacter soli]|uniref:TPM domain-containing protein n=1 Tax=Deminuibacter soli TaxID=2291815 RepID=A0A3E1NCP9_9BACT|nr:TPM domain-containing protein [Deminuibacter soli]RFM25733.1 TPM domain-containing protein [Deminuibacter soli]